MNELVFDHPLVLTAFSVFIPLALLGYFSERRRRIQKSLPEYLRVKLLVSRFFFFLFLTFIITAAAGPRWGIGSAEDEYRRLLDTVIAIDVSGSMQIPDGQTGNGQAVSRLERGLEIVNETVTAMPGTRFSVAISRDRGIVAIPLTWDSGVVLAFLDAAGTALTGRGTNLESLVDAAAGAFQPTYPSTKVILLVSDGEALSGSLRAALGRCKRDGIAVIALALGSEEGGNPPGESEIISRRDTGAMQMAAGQTGGIYIDGSSESASGALTAYLRSLAPESKTGGNGNERKPRWFIFVILAIIAFGVSKLSLLKLRGVKREEG